MSVASSAKPSKQAAASPSVSLQERDTDQESSNKSPAIARAPRPAPPPATPEQLAHLDDTLNDVVLRAASDALEPSLEHSMARALHRTLSTRSDRTDRSDADADLLKLVAGDALPLSPSDASRKGQVPSADAEETSRKHRKKQKQQQLVQKQKSSKRGARGPDAATSPSASPGKKHTPPLEALLERMPAAVVPVVRELERLRAQQRQLDKFNTNLSVQESCSSGGGGGERAKPETKTKPIAYSETRGLPSGRDIDRSIGEAFVELNAVLRFLPIAKVQLVCTRILAAGDLS